MAAPDAQLGLPVYKAPFFLPGGHLQTICPSFRNNFDASLYRRERVYTGDDDFLDLDWVASGHKRLAILSHGLEGSSHRPYIMGMAHRLKDDWDILAWNFRSCSGELNRQLRFYHSGATDDLARVIAHARTGGYKHIVLIGFSMGGNISLLYLAGQADSAVAGAIVFSVPCDLAGSARQLARFSNKIYMERFMRLLRQKVLAKSRIFPALDVRNLQKVKTFKDFDDRFTAPIHGFASAEDYWRKCSSLFRIGEIDRPAFIINAANDPFLSEKCYPVEEAAENPDVRLIIPRQGGHTGFPQKGTYYWSEEAAAALLQRFI